MLDRGRKEEQGSYLSRARFVPGPLLYMLSYLNHTEPGQMHKLRLRELQKLGHGPTASKEQSRDSVPSLFPPDILTWDTEISTPPPTPPLFCPLLLSYFRLHPVLMPGNETKSLLTGMDPKDPANFGKHQRGCHQSRFMRLWWHWQSVTEGRRQK